MPTLAKRVVGGLLAFLGLVLTVLGLWYAVHLGGSGTATFSATTTGSSPVLVPQTVLNRIDGDVKVTATTTKGGAVWLAAAAPSDAKAVLGKTSHLSVTGVSTQPWQLEAATTGTGETPALASTDVWRNTETGEGAVTMTIEQANAPESVIAQATKGQLERIDLTWERKSWFVQSVIGALVGLFLLLSGLSLLWSSRHPSAPRHGGPLDDRATPPEVPEAPRHARPDTATTPRTATPAATPPAATHEEELS